MLNKFKSAISTVTGGITGSQVNINGINVTVGDKLADGGFGIIYSATDAGGRNYALKSLQAPDDEHFQLIVNEFEMQKLCSEHQNVVKVYGMSSDRGAHRAMILMEFCPDNLVGRMNQCFNQGFDERTIVEVFQSVCAAVDFFHSQNPPITHRDLKPENVLFNEGTWKLCDFGSATRKIYKMQTQEERYEASDDIEKNTTALYRAPEMCDVYSRKIIGPKADVWALGCVLFKLCTFRDAFAEGTNLQILNVKYSWPPEKNVNEKFKDLVKYCFNVDPEKRPSARQVLGALYDKFPNLTNPKWKLSGGQQEAQEEASSEQGGTFNPFTGPPQPNAAPRQNAPKPQRKFPSAAAPSLQEGTFDPFSQTSQRHSQHVPDPFASPPAPQQQQPQFNSFSSPMPPQQNNPAFNSFSHPLPPQPGFNLFDQKPASDGSLIDFDAPAAPVAPVAAAPAQQQTADSLMPIIDSTGPPTYSVERLEKESDACFKEIIQMSELDLESNIFSIMNIPEKGPRFIMQLIHKSGVNARKILDILPSCAIPQFENVFEARKSIAFKFPQYEGNYALTQFMKQTKDKPVPIGQPPICTEAVKLFQNLIEQNIVLVRSFPNKDTANEAYCAYQVTAFILAKLKTFKINELYINETAIPLFKNQHGQLKRAFSLIKDTQTKFPQEPFDFDNQDFLKRIRPPASINLA